MIVVEATDELFESMGPVATPLREAINELRAAGFHPVLRGTVLPVIPFVPESDVPTFERKRELLDWFKGSKHLGSARILQGGVMFGPPEVQAEEITWPLTEPEVAMRYGLMDADGNILDS